MSGLWASNSTPCRIEKVLFPLLNGRLVFWCSLILILFNIKLCYVRGMLNKTFQRSFCFIRISVLPSPAAAYSSKHNSHLNSSVLSNKSHVVNFRAHTVRVKCVKEGANGSLILEMVQISHGNWTFEKAKYRSETF